MLLLMKQLLIEIDSELAQQLEQVAPARSRRRSEFIRAAIRKALWELREADTAKAYALQPDTADDAYVDPRAWEPAPKSARKRKRRQ